MGWLIGLAIVIVLVFAALWVTYRMAFYSPVGQQNDPYQVPPAEQYLQYYDRTCELIDELKARECEWVSITSRDGLTLTGRYYYTADGAPLDIGFHGYRGTALRDFCGGSRVSFALGHNLLLVDQRAHGQSQGHTTTFGAKERLDCLDWVNWANERFDCPPIALIGVSMGAATVLLAAGLELPDNVKCAVADCPYSDAEEMIVLVGRRKMPLPEGALRLLARGAARIIGGFRLADACPEQAVRRASIPILLLHGEADGLVPCAMSAAVEKACAAPVRRCTFPGADHAISFLVDDEGYTKAVTDFMLWVQQEEKRV